MLEDRIKIVIADPDTKGACVMEEMVRSISGLELVATVRSEAMLLVKSKNIQPDLIFLSPDDDLIPLSAMERLKQSNPNTQVIIVHSEHYDTDRLVEALEAGAYECLEKPKSVGSNAFNPLRLHLLTVVGLLQSRKRFFKYRMPKHKNRFFIPPADKITEPERLDQKPEIICIAASTGGPEILSRVFSILPAHLSVPILLVQHIPLNMTRFFARSLNRKSELDIIQAEEHMEIRPGKIYIAPGGKHMVVSKADDKGARSIGLTDGEPVNSVRPAADVLFESVARSYRSVMAIILTGMGEDGRQGVVHLKENTTCTCITQDAQSCVVYGMPRSVDEAGLSDEHLDPLSIAQKIVMSAQ